MPPGRSARTRIAERVGPSGTAALARAKESPVALRRFGGRYSGTETHGGFFAGGGREVVTFVLSIPTVAFHRRHVSVRSPERERRRDDDMCHRLDRLIALSLA